MRLLEFRPLAALSWQPNDEFELASRLLEFRPAAALSWVQSHAREPNCLGHPATLAPPASLLVRWKTIRATLQEANIVSGTDNESFSIIPKIKRTQVVHEQ